MAKLDSFTTRKHTEDVRTGIDLEYMSWGTAEEDRNVNPRGILEENLKSQRTCDELPYAEKKQIQLYL